MRCYHFTNFYFPRVGQEIQPSHAQMEMFVKYRNGYKIDHPDTEQYNMIYDWAQNHKTMICLNGGNHEKLSSLEQMLTVKDHSYPWASFYEEPGSIAVESTLTSIALIVPEKIYIPATNASFRVYDNPDGTKYLESSSKAYSLTPQEYDLMTYIGHCKLAR